MRSIAILTATRAEYGLLRNLIVGLNAVDEFHIEVLVTGAHLSMEQGFMYREIEKDGIQISKKIEILLESGSPAAISKSMGLAMIGFAEYFTDNKPDALIVLGDRYETLAVCCAAMNARIPIIHLYGGDTTEGAIDAVRHAITKMSYLHFTSTEESRKRVIQLGENPDRVFCVGAIGIDNALKEEKLTKAEVSREVGLDLAVPYGVVTFHPVTLEGNVEAQCRELFAAIDYLKEYQYIVTGANADCGGSQINQLWKKFIQERPNVSFVVSLGQKKYHSALKYASFVLGNSSSGLSEAPSFHVPTVNIGDRQRGRLRADSVFDCKIERQEIVTAVQTVMSPEFQNKLEHMENPYGDGNATERIIQVLTEKLSNETINLKKTFYNIRFQLQEE